MLEINLEYRKGILFIRLIGELSIYTVSKARDEFDTLIKDNGIKNVVINMENLEVIDQKGVNLLFYSYEVCKNNHGKLLICGLKNEYVKDRLKNSRILRYLKETNNELNAFNLLAI